MHDSVDSIWSRVQTEDSRRNNTFIGIIEVDSQNFRTVHLKLPHFDSLAQLSLYKRLTFFSSFIY